MIGNVGGDKTTFTTITCKCGFIYDSNHCSNPLLTPTFIAAGEKKVV
jgi:hypothetical protein